MIKISIKEKWLKILVDFANNVMASVVLTGVMQIIVYPLLARMFDANIYGTLLTIMGIINTIAVTLGNSLNNVRLIHNADYLEKKTTGDFNIILLISSVCSFALMLIIGNACFQLSFLENLFASLLIMLILLRCYYLVAYRINLNFQMNLYCNIICAVGYLFGILLVSITHIWLLAFIFSEAFGLVFLIKTTSLYKEPLKKTRLWNKTVSSFFLLMLAGASGNVLIYLDRLLLYPVLGGNGVAIYTVASFFGKTLGIVMTPISGVLLGYFSQKNYNMNNRKFWTINLITVGIGFIFLLIVTPMAPWFTEKLYPTLFCEAKPFIFLANIAAVISMIANMAQPAVLKFLPTYWQVIKEVIYGGIYILLAMCLLNRYGLYGFCIATIVANLAKVIFLYFIGTCFFAKSQQL